MATIRDAEGTRVGQELADLDVSAGKPMATEADVLAYLDEVASDDVSGWAQSACWEAYQARYRAAARRGEVQS